MAFLPLFPLPNVVLFPGVALPLHIFEPRYRAMVADALEADRRIGMVLLQPGWEPAYQARPSIYPIGCSGVIASAAKLEDGRYNVVLQGLDRFRIVSEDDAGAYRRARVEPLHDLPLDIAGRAALTAVRIRLAEFIGLGAHPGESGAEASAAPLLSMPDAEFVHTLAQGLDLDPLEKQALLERESLLLRAQSLADLLEMRRLVSNLPAVPARPQ
ncbi:MAG TPA: LON peptidase substrate-binding domain-containing protein [Vicinamibacterales bacterium]|nr:LON peptidase substrate-binding domain-containing protein [Vicinamibacterales bacterium]